MSYANAKACFIENRDAVNPQTDPQTYNLNHGLARLTAQLQSDMDDLKKKVARLEIQIKRLSS
jgi:hypothetical protein